MNIDTINMLVDTLDNLDRQYLFVRYYEYTSPFEVPYQARAIYNKRYMNLYDFMRPDLERVHTYESSLGTAVALKYKPLCPLSA